MYKIIISGTRYFEDYELLCATLDKFVGDITDNIEIVSGTCRGADSLGERYAKEHNLAVKKFPAYWNAFGKRAGIMRNAEMADYANALVAFWDGKSKGTKNMICEAKKRGLRTTIVRYNVGKTNDRDS